jgi:hypothetical protein
LQKAFDAFFRRIKAGETPGYPRFKGVHRFRSFGLKEPSGASHNDPLQEDRHVDQSLYQERGHSSANSFLS